jgi:PAS domain S-box-containing protein
MVRPETKTDPITEDLELLLEVSQLFTLQDLETVLRRVIELSARTVGAIDASLILYDDQQIRWQYVLSLKEDEPEKTNEVVDRIHRYGLAGWVMRNRQIALVDDTRKDPRWEPVPDEMRSALSALCLPLIYQDKVIAVITLVHNQPGHFNSRHMRLMTIVANQAAVAIYNLQLLKQVQLQRRQLENMLHAIPDVMLVLDKHGRILITNTAALSMLGAQTETAVIGRRLDELALPDESLRSVIEIICETGDNPFQGETDLLFETHSANFKRDYQVTMSTWRDFGNRDGGFIVIMHDITVLRDLHRFKDEMLRLASHDLRSPLSLIVGYTSMITLDTPDPDSPVHQHIAMIQSSTSRMNTLLEDLLRVEQVRSSPLELHEQIDPHKLVKIVLVNARPDAENKHLKVNAQVKLEGMGNLIGDPVLIRQAMENLVGNAVKYTPAGGAITIRSYFEDERFNFEVEDTGIGIPEDQLSHVFESFYRVPRQDQEVIQGVGLGLSLVRTVVERHGGQVWVTSEQGKGSRFGFWLPLEFHK